MELVVFIRTIKTRVHRSYQSGNKSYVCRGDGQRGGLQEKRNTNTTLSSMDNITPLIGLSLGEVVHRSRGRGGWRVVVASIRGATSEHAVDDE
ncbi:hypothetical protein ElyMa_003785500 [Elysia marginata]|uniref:Uncharacterized protein n=1 Tax=Elysia marginata TaxID=1093978 RepID=A0AAV4FBV8_9GAST|nr:hypothetical protein ElyMa_003785500 [Elysia marginata]